MFAATVNYIIRFFSFFWLTGPVFDKELRISSRNRRNYILRFTYISLLLTILFFIWVRFVDYRSNDIVQISRMAQAGKYIITCIVWFQFCAAQIIAIVMLSNSISDEIYHKTLGMLMATPITSLQIVMGKLFSKLLQLLLLLAISLPLLAIVRLFGGVPWKFVTSSLCITFTTVIFVSSLSLFFSIYYRRAYSVIIVTFVTLFLIFGVLPFIFITIVNLTKLYTIPNSERILLFILYQPNPYITFLFNTLTMIEPQNSIGSFYSSVYRNSIFMSILSFILLLISISKVRKVALRQATGQLISSRQRKSIKYKSETSANNKSYSCVSVTGPPVLWKELILPLRRNIRIRRVILLLLFLGLLFYSYWYLDKENSMRDKDAHTVYALIFIGLGSFFTIVLSSTNITSEKESRSWPLLLSSTLSDNNIVLSKFIGILSRCFPVWLLLLGHVFYFSFVKMIHPAGPLLTSILVTWIIIFLCSTGIYFGSCFKHTTTAVIMNFLLAVFIWGLVPLFFGIVSVILENSNSFEHIISYNPFVQIFAIIQGTADTRAGRPFTSLNFNWGKSLNYMETLHIILTSFLIYIIFAILFLWRAKKRFRYRIF